MGIADTVECFSHPSYDLLRLLRGRLVGYRRQDHRRLADHRRHLQEQVELEEQVEYLLQEDINNEINL